MAPMPICGFRSPAADDQLDYTFDFGTWLAPLDRIANATVLPRCGARTRCGDVLGSPRDSAPWACRRARRLCDRVRRHHAAGTREERLRHGDAAMIYSASLGAEPGAVRAAVRATRASDSTAAFLRRCHAVGRTSARLIVLDYGLDCRESLAGTRDTIAASALRSIRPMTSGAARGQLRWVLIAWLSGGTPGTNYTANWEIKLRQWAELVAPVAILVSPGAVAAGAVAANASGALRAQQRRCWRETARRCCRPAGLSSAATTIRTALLSRCSRRRAAIPLTVTGNFHALYRRTYAGWNHRADGSDPA